jgi:hypothetical protein
VVVIDMFDAARQRGAQADGDGDGDEQEQDQTARLDRQDAKWRNHAEEGG